MGASSSPAPKMRTSPDNSQPERAILERCCSALYARGTAHTDALRVGLLASLSTSTFKCSIRCPLYTSPASLLQKCERLQIDGSQKGLAWKAVAQPHLPMALLEQRHRDWGCLLLLLPQTSKVVCGWGALPVSSRSTTLKKRMSPDSSHPEGDSLESCCSASSAHGPARTEAQRLGLLACLDHSNF